MKPLIAFLFRPQIGHPQAETLAIRAPVGLVFLVSGALKLLFDNQGVGRFTRIGLPSPGALATFVGVVEVAAGALLLAGLFTRLATLPLLIDMLVALFTTKLPLLFEPGPEPVSAAPKQGLLAFLYQARLDLTMLSACGYLLLVGGGLWSLDAWLTRRRWEGRMSAALHPRGAADA